MSEFVGQDFFSIVDRGGLEIDSLRFKNCQFVSCGFSLASEAGCQSHAKSIEIVDCHVCDGHVGPGVIEDSTIDGLSTDNTIACFGTLFRNVTFRGKIGKISFCKRISASVMSSHVEQQFEEVRKAFYCGVDKALDISEAHFDELDIVGIPARLIKIDPLRHFVLSRSNAQRPDWRDKVNEGNDYWLFVIEEFLKDGDESTVLVVPEGVSGREQSKLRDGLLELRDLGVVS